MAGKIVKSTDVSKKDREFNNKKRKNPSFVKNSKRKDADKKRWRGPRLPNPLRKELERAGSDGDEDDISGDEDDISGDEDNISGDDVHGYVYEYEEGIAEEETKKNKRFDPIENYQEVYHGIYEEESIDSDEENLKGDDDENERDGGRHARMLQEITGLPSEAFAGEKRTDFIISEAHTESEFNPSSDILDGNGRVSIDDLLAPLHDKSGFSKLRKSVRRMESKSVPTLTPLPKTKQDRLERKAAYELSKKDITKWEPLVKRNREAPTLYFDEDVDLGYTTIGAIAAEFEPRTAFEKKIASLVNHKEVVEAHQNDGARLLELNELSVEDVKERQDRLAKMRSMLFRHEMKAKRIKKIKSKTYHRMLKKDREKAAEAAVLMDPEAAKELAMKQEFKRAEERMTLKHKNSSKWAKRILDRGLQVQDERTREAFAEQLNQHNALTRKMNSLRHSSSSEESSDDDEIDDISAGSDQEAAVKLLTRAKEKTLKVLENNEELPMEGVLSLPFMVRGLKKRKEAAEQEAKLAVKEYESSLKQLGDKSSYRNRETGPSSGRRVFGVAKREAMETSEKDRSDNYLANSDSEVDINLKEDNVLEHNKGENLLQDTEIDPNVLREECEVNHDSVLKSFEDIVEDPERGKSYEVAFLASGSWRKMKRSSEGVEMTEVSREDACKSLVTVGPLHHVQNAEEEDEDGDSNSGEEMVDGILSPGTKSYELPSQAELIHRAFAGDDVEEDFEKDKEAVLNEENPEPEKPAALPGWGQWTYIQKKKGLPSWILEEHNMAKKKREEALKKRKDAHLHNVIISEKLDKKAEKLHTKTLPYPYTSKEVFEQSIRMPIGPEFNPATTVGALNRPEVVKRAGVKIKPIQYEDMRGKTQTHKTDGPKQKKGKNKKQSIKRQAAKV